jgi:hypothetical protein
MIIFSQTVGEKRYSSAAISAWEVQFGKRGRFNW